MSFLDRHPPLRISPPTAERQAFQQALAAAEVVIARRRIEDATTAAREDWYRKLPELMEDARRVIAERGGDPNDNDLDED